jgi:hypothetical protein
MAGWPGRAARRDIRRTRIALKIRKWLGRFTNIVEERDSTRLDRDIETAVDKDMVRKQWAVIAHSDQRDHHSECPVMFDKREHAERLAEGLIGLMPSGFRFTVEEREVDVEDTE